MQLAGALQELVEEEPGTALPGLLHELVERLQPVARLGRIDIRELVLELV
jgi:hypothetical protein